MPAASEKTYEVESKYRLADTAALIDAVRALGGDFAAPQEQVDTYYAHPERDFAKTDEALRIRRVGGDAFITYKGPKIDSDSKTREEIELPIAGGTSAADSHARLLEALGFRAVAEVRKQRRKAAIIWQARHFEIALDEVASVGTFVELETVADPSQLEAAQAALLSLAEKLALRGSERRSYLELLLLSRR
jgi:adenylate cyclase class 2